MSSNTRKKESRPVRNNENRTSRTSDTNNVLISPQLTITIKATQVVSKYLFLLNDIRQFYEGLSVVAKETKAMERLSTGATSQCFDISEPAFCDPHYPLWVAVCS